MAGSGITSGANQRLFLKLESISDTLASSTTWADFVGAGKIIDPTSETTFNANMVPLTGDLKWGGSAKVANWSEWGGGSNRTDKSLITGQSIENIEFELVFARSDTMRKALEDVATGSACWFVVLRQTTSGRANLTNASIDVGYGTIASDKTFKDESPSSGMVTIAPQTLGTTIDAS